MSSNTLDSLSRAILETLEDERVTLETLERTFDTSRENLEDRLAHLVDNGLVRAVTDAEYELTENGLRVLRATPTGEYDNRIDTSPEIAQTIAEFSLRPDEESAVRSAFSFLRYWGDATTAELIDGCYSESPATYDTADSWWENCVRDRLASLPTVTPPQNRSSESSGSSRSPGSIDSSGTVGTGAELWEYEDTAVIEMPDDDGRDVADPPSSSSPFGSVRHGLEKIPLSETERTTARVAFAALFDRETATAEDFVESVYDDYGDEFDSSEEWTNWLVSVFEALPGVERISETTNGITWSYSPVSDETKSNDVP